ncbi:PTS sugar transporter subunit IIA [Citrobacter sp.]|uniref:PTS sugar transporter subunit IIA n=1 Tax=Citrobacter sp. TaxID=1896336 RepID=UPI0028FEC02D|nr:PTS sugar transporter subunit IIA [Citrobacter sp.]EHG7887966.1 PTS sugar transporter subunit IIA [Citrobacter braakii]MDU2843908.1 PTS sugar transporter subunit IIA [Citrobacter sp.]
MNLYDIIILTHGDAGKELLNSSEMIVGKTKNTTAISLIIGMSPETLMEQTRKILRPNIKTVILTDIYGGTPSNVATVLSREYPIHCISGINLAMLLEANMLQDSDKEITIEEYVQCIHDAGKDMVQSYQFNKG